MKTVDSEGIGGDVLQWEYNFVLFRFVVMEEEIEMKLKLPPEDIELENTVMELDIGSSGELEESRCSNHTSEGKVIQWKFLMMMRNFWEIIMYQ